MKAIVMAGGEGSRLRPLTCTVPKPMVRVLGKPMLSHIFDLLLRHGVTEAAVTLGYLPEAITRAYADGYGDLRLSFVQEEEPLGTAGSVRNAAGNATEPLLVISGDAMCNFDLTKILAYHRASGAKITIVAVEAADPREYGLLRTQPDGRVTGFLEKPAWSQAVSRLANTGVYIMEPDCLSLIPRGRSYDFAKDLFPLMLEREMPIYCYHTEDYWCDVGTIDAYLRCQQEVMQGAMPVDCAQPAPGIFAQGKLPPGSYTLHPPVYIGADVAIGERAEIGPFAAVDRGAVIGRGVKLRYGAVLEEAQLEAETHLTGALVCAGAMVRAGAALFENAVVGAGSVVGAGAVIHPQVLIWPGKRIEPGAHVRSNIKYGRIRTRYLGAEGVDESGGGRLDAETCVRLGASVGSTENGKLVGVAHDGTQRGKTMLLAASAGLADVGSSVLDFGVCFEAQFRYLVQYCGLRTGMLFRGAPVRQLRFCGEGGLPITRAFERGVESGMSFGSFRQAADAEIREIRDVSAAKQLYKYAILRHAPLGLQGVEATVESENGGLCTILQSVLSMLGCRPSERLRFRLSPDGMAVTALLNGSPVPQTQLLVACCYHELRAGHDVAVPYDAPMVLDDIAAEYGRSVLRYLHTPADRADAAARQLAARQGFERDGSFLTVKLLSILKTRACGLETLLSELPEDHLSSETVPLPFSPVSLAEAVGGETAADNQFEGVRLTKDAGRLLLVPEHGGERVRILAEAATMEAADELCADMAAILRAAGNA